VRGEDAAPLRKLGIDPALRITGFIDTFKRRDTTPFGLSLSKPGRSPSTSWANDIGARVVNSGNFHSIAPALRRLACSETCGFGYVVI